jgi:hypothetical protein
MKAEKTSDYSFNVVWSNAHEEYVGFVVELPEISYSDHNKMKALEGVKHLFQQMLDEGTL